MKITRISRGAALVLALLLLCPAFTARASCAHEWVYDSVRSIYVHDAQGHMLQVQWVHKCSHCSALRYVNNGNPGPRQAHTYYYASGRHNLGGTHDYTYRCTVCARTYTITVSCDSPPRNIPSRLPEVVPI